MKEDHMFLSNGRLEIKEINQWGSFILVEWLCTKEIINKTGTYISVQWSCAHKRNKSMRTLIFDRMVVYKRMIKWKRIIYFLKRSRANKINKSVRTPNSGRMVVHTTATKIPEHEGSISPSSIYGQLPYY